MPRDRVELARIREPEELVDALPGVVYRAMPLDNRPIEVSLTTHKLDDITWQAGHCTPLMAIAAAGPATAVVQLPLENVESLVLNGQAVRPGIVGLYGPGGEVLRRNPQSSRYAAFMLPAERAEALLCPPPASPLLRPQASGLFQASPDAWNRTAHIVRAATEAVTDIPHLFDLEQPRNALQASLLHALRELLASADGAESSRRIRGARAWRRIVLLADDYLRTHVARPLYTEEICSGLGVSASSLAEAFHATFGVSPHRFLKLRRLAMVRTALRSRDGRPTLVKSVALSHGFWRLGQFAHDYRATYGESPSETLARARGLEPGAQLPYAPVHDSSGNNP